MNRLRVAVVGAGHLGRIHARLLRNLEHATLVGIVDPDADARHSLAHQHHVPAFGHHASLADCADAAIIACPTTYHAQVGTELLDRGLHLLMEKPIAVDSTQADQLVDTAARRRRVLQVGHVERFNPAFRASRDLLVEPKYVDARRTGRFTWRSTDVGVVLDLMIHDIDLILDLVGSEVVDVTALGVSVLGQHEDMAQARLTFRNGCIADLAASRISLEPSRRMNVYCPTAFASVDFAAHTAQIVEPRADILDRTFDLTDLSGESGSPTDLFDSALTHSTMDVESRNAIEDELTEFVDCIRFGRTPTVDGMAGRDAVAVADRVLAAIATHGWNGASAGPVGPLAVPGASILRAPEWPAVPQRKAG